MSDLLTSQIRKDLKQVIQDQRFEPLLFIDSNLKHPIQNKTLIIQLNKSYDNTSFGLLVYNNEYHILGKAMRLLTHLQDEVNIYDYFHRNGIARILITDAPDPKFLNDTNKWVFDTEHSRKIVLELLWLQRQNYELFETAIRSMVAENPL